MWTHQMTWWLMDLWMPQRLTLMVGLQKLLMLMPTSLKSRYPGFTCIGTNLFACWTSISTFNVGFIFIVLVLLSLILLIAPNLNYILLITYVFVLYVIASNIVALIHWWLFNFFVCWLVVVMSCINYGWTTCFLHFPWPINDYLCFVVYPNFLLILFSSAIQNILSITLGLCSLFLMSEDVLIVDGASKSICWYGVVALDFCIILLSRYFV